MLSLEERALINEKTAGWAFKWGMIIMFCLLAIGGWANSNGAPVWVVDLLGWVGVVIGFALFIAMRKAWTSEYENFNSGRSK